jgi:hypothetical protein
MVFRVRFLILEKPQVLLYAGFLLGATTAYLGCAKEGLFGRRVDA